MSEASKVAVLGSLDQVILSSHGYKKETLSSHLVASVMLRAICFNVPVVRNIDPREFSALPIPVSQIPLLIRAD